MLIVFVLGSTHNIVDQNQRLHIGKVRNVTHDLSAVRGHQLQNGVVPSITVSLRTKNNIPNLNLRLDIGEIGNIAHDLRAMRG